MSLPPPSLPIYMHANARALLLWTRVTLEKLRPGTTSIWHLRELLSSNTQLSQSLCFGVWFDNFWATLPKAFYAILTSFCFEWMGKWYTSCNAFNSQLITAFGTLQVHRDSMSRESICFREIKCQAEAAMPHVREALEGAEGVHINYLSLGWKIHHTLMCPTYMLTCWKYPLRRYHKHLSLILTDHFSSGFGTTSYT